MKKYLADKVVVITGASAGVGRATALAFAKHKAKIALIARGEIGLAATKQQIETLGSQAQFYSVDVSNYKKLELAADKIENELGPIDIWVNNAMCSVFSPIQDFTPEEYRRVTEVTYLGQVYGAMIALKKMKPRNRGKIVFVGSALAYRGIPLQSAYCGAKHGIEGFFESLRCELIHDKSAISVSIVHLPAVNTPQFDWVKNKLPNRPKPMGHVYEPEIPARAILYAACHKRRQIYVAFPTFETIIANKIAPSLLDYYLAKTGYKGQQTSEKKNPAQLDNVWEPVPGDFGAHGRFDSIASRHSPMLWMTTHRLQVWLIIFIILLIIGIILYENISTYS